MAQCIVAKGRKILFWGKRNINKAHWPKHKIW